MIKKIIELFVTFTWLLGKRKRKQIYNEAIRNIRVVQADEIGFSIFQLNPDLKTVLRWSDIEGLLVTVSYVEVSPKNYPKIKINNSSTGYFSFIRNVPIGFKDFDYKSIDTLLNKLTDCEICGLISVLDGDCESCGEKSWDLIDKNEYKNKEEYLREMQKEVFKDEELTNVSEFGFESSSNWKIY